MPMATSGQGAWVTDKPKGWDEIHPTWKVTNE